MTLKLVHDATVVEITLSDLADDLRVLAGNIGNAKSAVVIMLGDNIEPVRVLGDDLTDHELIGIFEAAKFDVLRELLEGE